MKKHAIPLAFLLAAPLGAQTFEVGFFLGPRQGPSPYADASGTASPDRAETKTVYGARFGYSMAKFDAGSLQVTAGYQPESRLPVAAPLSGQGEVTQSHWSAGAMFNFKTLVALGAGLEFRSEKLAGSGPGGISDSTTYNRAWVRLNAGYVFGAPQLSPFIGVEAAFPLSSADNKLDTAADELKSLAPRNQIGIYAGLRF